MLLRTYHPNHPKINIDPSLVGVVGLGSGLQEFQFRCVFRICAARERESLLQWVGSRQ